jgi:hypothetical protein
MARHPNTPSRRYLRDQRIAQVNAWTEAMDELGEVMLWFVHALSEGVEVT